MDDLIIQQIWKQNERLLENTRALNVTLLKEVKLDKAKSSLKSLLFLPASTMVFFIIAASYAMYFAVLNWGTWYFMFSGAIVALFSIMLVVSSIKQLKQILSVNYNAPILKLQKEVSQIKLLVIHNLRIATWALPFGPFIGLFLIKALFDVDLVQLINFNMVVSFGVTTIVLVVLSLLFLRALRPQSLNKNWLNWLLLGSGSQVNEALGFLSQIEEFENENNNEV